MPHVTKSIIPIRNLDYPQKYQVWVSLHSNNLPKIDRVEPLN